MASILVVEDEIKLANVIVEYLHQSQFQAHALHNGGEVVEWVRQNTVDLILLDLMLPEKDGLTICKEIRAFSSIPIIMLTAKVEEIDRIIGLELGADDYVCKPFSPREVVARVKAHLRRNNWQAQEEQNVSKIVLVNPDSHQVVVNGTTLSLTVIEFDLLRVLSSHPGRIFSRAQLIDSIYKDYRVVSNRTVDSHIKKLRKKLLEVVPNMELIHSIYGVGYKYEESSDIDQ